MSNDYRFYNPTYSTGYLNTPGFSRVEPLANPYEVLAHEEHLFKLKEEELKKQYETQGHTLLELDKRYKETLAKVKQLEDENMNSKRTFTADMKNMYTEYMMLENKLKEYEKDNQTLIIEIKKRDDVIIAKEADIRHLMREKQELLEKLDSVDLTSVNEINELRKILDEQKNEIGELRRKLNLSYDQKRKAESETDTLKFEMENLRQKYDNDVREKEFRLTQSMRVVDIEVENRVKELTIQLDAFERVKRENIILETKVKELMNEIALHINAEKLLKQEIQTRENELEFLKRELVLYKGSKNPVPCSFQPTSHLKIIKICNKRFAMERKNLLYTIWKLCYHLKNETKFNIKQKNGESLDENNGQTRNSKKIRFDFDDYNDISIATSLADGVLRTVKYIRERANSIIFEIFIRSANNAEQKKTNSLILFSINIKELDTNTWNSLTLCLDAYIIIRRLMKVFHPKFMKIKKPAGSGILEKKLQYSLGKGVPKTGDRNELNKWIENSLVFIVNKRKYDKDKNKEFMFLFRMLAIKYRIMYPLRGKELDIENDLKIYIDHKILSSLHKLLKIGTKDNHILFDPIVPPEDDIARLADR